MRKIPYFTLVSVAVLLCGSLQGCKNPEHDHSEHSHPAEHSEEEEHSEEAEDVDHDHDEHGGIHLKPEVATSFGVMTEKIIPSDFSEITRVSGVVESLPADEGVVTATRSGILSINQGIATGSAVRAGASIGSISSTAVQGGNSVSQSRARRDAAKRELDRLTPLHADGVVSTAAYNAALQAYEEAEAESKSMQQGSATLKAPGAGVITSLLARPGQYVEIGQPIATISGNTHLTLRADVPMKYASRVPAIVSANVRSESSSEAVSLDNLAGKIISSGKSVAKDGYIPVRFSFVNDGSLVPGSFAEVFLKSGPRPNVLSVPIEAIVEVSGNHILYSFDGDDYEKHIVKLGPSDGMRVEIISGIEPGEEVVVKGAQAVRMAETSATAVPGHTHNH